MTEIFKYDVDADGIATITWDLPGKSMNVMTQQGIEELEQLIDRVLGDAAVKGAVITSAKDDMAGGMDLNVVAGIKAEAAKQGGNPAEVVFNYTMRMHKMLRKIELAGMDPRTQKGGKPIASATPGTAAGIGYELMLATHRRFAADNPKAKIGLPEVLVGLFPGAGGTTRLIRMFGVMAAAPFLLEGKMSDPAKAKAAGLIDEVVPKDQLLSAAKAWVKSAIGSDLVKPWDKKDYKLPGGGPYHPAGAPMFMGGVAMAQGKSKGVYPNTKAMLATIYEGSQIPFDAALRNEARWFTTTLMDPRSEAMVRSLFINKQAIEKGASRPANVPDQSVKKLGVLGAGMMGAGIAYVGLRAGCQVVLMDRDQAAADKGLATITGILDEEVSKRRLTPEKKAEALSRLTATPDYEALRGADLVIEAVFGDMKIKADVTQKAEAVLGPDAIYASNTSTLPISDLAKASVRPKNFIGIHFFSPVHKMALVEIIRGKQTGDVAVAKALDFVRQIRKTPIVVNDARYFYANRCILPYVNEGVRMLAEGVPAALVENGAKNAGFPVGPLQLTDETSLDLGLKIAKATKAALGNAYETSEADFILADMVEGKGRLGRKSNAGFYDYDANGKRLGLHDGLAAYAHGRKSMPTGQEVADRLMAVQAIEAIRALEEGVLMDVREGDVGAILGWGFAPWSGGPLSWVDMIGTKTFAAMLAGFEARFGKRYAAPALLTEMAATDDKFYHRFNPAKKAA